MSEHKVDPRQCLEPEPSLPRDTPVHDGSHDPMHSDAAERATVSSLELDPPPRLLSHYGRSSWGGNTAFSSQLSLSSVGSAGSPASVGSPASLASVGEGSVHSRDFPVPVHVVPSSMSLQRSEYSSGTAASSGLSATQSESVRSESLHLISDMKHTINEIRNALHRTYEEPAAILHDPEDLAASLNDLKIDLDKLKSEVLSLGTPTDDGMLRLSSPTGHMSLRSSPEEYGDRSSPEHPGYSELSLPPPSLEHEKDSEATHKRRLDSSLPSSTTSSPLILPTTILQKVTSKVQRMLSHQPDEGTGPVTIRRNSGAARMASEPPVDNIVIPDMLKQGITFLRVTHNKRVQRVLKLDEETGILSWNSKLTSRLSLDRICEIYTGDDARNYREEFKVSSELANRWATIIHQRPGDTKLKALHIVVATQKEFNVLMGCIKQLLAFRREIMSGLAKAGRHFVDVHWQRTSGDKRKLSLEQFEHLTKQLHINCSKDYIRKVFNEADIDNSHYLDFEEFQKLVDILKRRDDIETIFKRYATDGFMDQSTFELFVTNEQKQSMASGQVTKIFSRFSSPLNNLMTSRQFAELLATSSIFPPLQKDDQDLDRPLNEYWISSSHNTYLTGKQFGAGSSVEGYIRTLQDGCRCIEIDVWDGSNGPVVRHGTSIAKWTGSLDFGDVIHAVIKYGFISSPFPLILSLEIRCKEENQRKLVQILKMEIGDQLVTKPLMPNALFLPSPSELKHKVLIKVKTSGNESNYATTDSFASGTDTEDEGLSSGSSAASVSSNILKSSISRPKIVPELSELGVYLSNRRFKDFNLPESKTINHMFSFNERTVKSMVKDEALKAQLERHNKNFLVRVYPSILRLKSTNFDPIQFWKLGFQMVALNWQTSDIGMQVNKAFHAPHIGYVHKPAWMRSPGTPLPTDQYKIHLEIISAQQLSRPKELKQDEPLSPYVSVDIYGLSNKAKSSWTTQAVVDNGFNPVWNYSCEIEIPEYDLEFACLRFTVATNSTTFANYIAKVSKMHQGYRHVPLQDVNGEDYLFSSLFIRLTRARIEP